MKILHLFSNAKWTGPAEPALNLCVALRTLGVDADFACAPYCGKSINKVIETARDRGIEPITRFHLRKHHDPLRNFLDSNKLAAFLKSGEYHLVHCHLDNAHRIAKGAAAKRGIPLIRSSYEGAGLTGKAAKLLPGTAFLIEPSYKAWQHDTKTNRFPAQRARVVPGAVDVARFDPARELPDGRSWLGVPHDAFVIGIVARMQTHRHYEGFFRVLRRLIDNTPNTHAIVVGRGTKQEDVAVRPVRELGLENNVHFSGFIDGENYVGMLKAFDVKVFLVPGSDGTCRAVREAMAMGKPAVVADRGMLSEIVDDGTDGLVFDASESSLFDALDRLASSPKSARAMGRAARDKAVQSYSLEAQAASVKAIYDEVLGSTSR